MKLGRLLFGMGKKSNYLLVGLFAFLAAAIYFLVDGSTAGVILSTFPLLGMTAGEQEKAEQLFAEIEKRNKSQLETFRSEYKTLGEDFRKGIITEEAFNTKFSEISKKLEKFDADKFEQFKTTLENLETALKAQGSELKSLKDGGMPSTEKTLKSEIKAILETADFKEFVESNGKKKASFSLKAPVSVTSNYTGTSRVHITTRDARVVDHPQVERLNIRDLLTVMPTDLPYLAFTEVYDWDRAVGMNTENGALAESSFKVREATTDVKRIGTHVPISKRMLRSATYVLNHLMQRLPAQVKYAEDFQLLFGDGAGNNLTGIFKVASNFATLVNTAISGAAGAVSSVATYDGGTKTIINLAANQLINNGDIITIANATAAGYNASHKVIVVSQKQIVIELAYVAEADTSAWTFVVNHPFKNAQDAAQQIDVIRFAKAIVSQQEYTASGAVLNPVDATLIESLKDNTENYLDVQRVNGVLTISGMPIVETTAMPAGKFAVGDWTMAAALLEFTSLTLEFSESTTEKLGNYVEAIIQEEVLFPIYNKYMFVVGDFSTAIAAINKI